MTEERTRLGKSRAELAKVCNKSTQAIGQFERGTSLPGSEVLIAYADAGADVLYILTGRRESLRQKSEVREASPSYEVGRFTVDTVLLASVIDAIEKHPLARTLLPVKRAELIAQAYQYTLSSVSLDPGYIQQLVNPKK